MGDIKEIVTDTDKVLEGVNAMADTVALTMGPKGGTVILTDFYGNPKVTKDGVTVAKSIDLRDPVQNLSCKLLRQAAEQRNSAKEVGRQQDLPPSILRGHGLFSQTVQGR